ncbi:GNAT family N-acetyltransferase [Parasphingorhabdus litoris]|uniref:GNAT family N-acetyltransferase n=1 Tax=Parasphingorhabdus litoris TaxID=394733 RepID=A0ABN1AHQ6_9SPHN
MAEDADYLPAIERSAGSAFLQVPGLEWLAGSDDIVSAEDQLRFIEQGLVWIAESADGERVGFLTAEQFEDEYHIWELDVHQAHQKRGIGRGLIKALTEKARRETVRAITLTTFRDLPFNEKFYQHMGFQTLEEEQQSKRLTAILATEEANGLPAERRCAMQLPL